MTDRGHSVCEACGATVFAETIDTGVARYEGGKLMCKVCVEEYERAHEGRGQEEGYALGPIEFEGDEAPDDAVETAMESSGSTIAYTGQALGSIGAHDESKYQRPLDPNAQAATRCRTFHCKLNDAAAEYMNNAVNEWADTNPEITIKFATSTIGIFEGKTKDQNLIVTVFY